MRAPVARRLVLLGLAVVVGLGCLLPGVFHDTYVEHSLSGHGVWTHHRNQLTGDVTTSYRSHDRMWCCFGGHHPADSVFGD